MTVDTVKKRISRRVAAGSSVLTLLVLGGVAFWIISSASSTNARTLSVWEENCSIAYISPSRPNAGSVCAVPINPIHMPSSFNMSSVSQSGGGLADYYFGVILAAHELVRVSMNSSNPLNFYVYLDNRTGYDVKSLRNEVSYYGHLLTNSTGIMTYDNQLLSEGGGLYIIELTVNQPIPVANVALDIRNLVN